MSIDPHGPSSHPSREPAEDPRLVCAKCGTDRALALHSITALHPPSDDWVEVGYACTACNAHYLHQADVVAVAAVLNRAPCLEDVLVFGGHYIHCGQPMQTLSSQIRRLSAAAYTDGQPEDAVDVNLDTRVLRCACGFQIELPE
jgi:hypothetical protein